MIKYGLLIIYLVDKIELVEYSKAKMRFLK